MGFFRRTRFLYLEFIIIRCRIRGNLNKRRSLLCWNCCRNDLNFIFCNWRTCFLFVLSLSGLLSSNWIGTSSTLITTCCLVCSSVEFSVWCSSSGSPPSLSSPWSLILELLFRNIGQSLLYCKGNHLLNKLRRKKSLLRFRHWVSCSGTYKKIQDTIRIETRELKSFILKYS